MGEMPFVQRANSGISRTLLRSPTGSACVCGEWFRTSRHSQPDIQLSSGLSKVKVFKIDAQLGSSEHEAARDSQQAPCLPKRAIPVALKENFKGGIDRGD